MTGDSPSPDALARALADADGVPYRRRTDGGHRLESGGGQIGALLGLSTAPERWLDHVHPADQEDVRAAVGRAGGEPTTVTYRIRTDGGWTRWVRDRFARHDDDQIEGVCFEVTQEIAHRESLERDAELLDDIFEHVPIHVYIKDEEARHQYVSDHIDFPEEVIGKRDIDIGFTEPESGRRAYEDDMRVIETDETILDQEEHYPAVGEWDLTSKVPIYDEDGETMGLLGATRRITERKQAKAELERKTERLEQFVDIVSHDIRNPLSVARGYAELIEEPDAETEYVEQVRQSIERANAILDDVLALSRQGAADLDPEVLQLSTAAETAWSHVETAEATLSLPDEDLEFRGDRSQLARALENLFKNAVEHGSTSPDSQAQQDAVEHGSTSPDSKTRQDAVEHGGETVTITVERIEDGFAVEDDGPGIPAEERERVFEQQYTTAETGTGFGLAIVEQVIDAHGWEIDLSASASGGARFEITGVDVVGSRDD
ncbi:PAS domain-containing sensor histidine kinase [Natranaeroarchaeum aerophilus]|uniref:histidine kinase n=1 Tax=Natranaeroarchaeum aerophilus TaxID=2917711 RepID=A0AAE3K3F3_9EURY|nr:ATP-binding protein [Natranaeroarchaeum aerophilus]MCL9812458.1 ATP-binding protein [Natranaeroarchaeum aerophilus]